MNTEELKRVFIGQKYDKLINKNFSLPALLLGGTYYIYRKMYLLGCLYCLLTSMLISIWATTTNIIIFISYLLFICSFSLGFGNSYRKHVNKKVQNIVSTSDSEATAIAKAKKQGNTNILLAIVLTIVISILSSFIINKIPFFNSTPENNDLTQNENIVVEEPQEDLKEDEQPIAKIILDDWIGTYKHSSGGIAEIYRNSENTVGAKLTLIEGDVAIHNMNLNEEGQLYYDSDDDIVLEKTEAGFNVIEATEITTPIWGKCIGEFTKTNFEDLDWSGTYTNQSKNLILSQISDTTLYITIDNTPSVFTNDFDEEAIHFKSAEDNSNEMSIDIRKTNEEKLLVDIINNDYVVSSKFEPGLAELEYQTDDSENTSNDLSNVELISSEDAKYIEDYKPIKNINDWSGVYEADNAKITIYRNDLNFFSLSLEKTNIQTNESENYNKDFYFNNKKQLYFIPYQEKNKEVILEKTKNGLKVADVIIDSSDLDNDNLIWKDLKNVEFKKISSPQKTNLIGTYCNSAKDKVVTISFNDEVTIYFNIYKNNKYSIFNKVKDFSVDEFSKSVTTDEYTFPSREYIEVTHTLTFKKTDTGIEIIGTSSNGENTDYVDASGIYEKIE